MKPLVKLKPTPVNELQIPIEEFLKSYNKTIPTEFPKASKLLLLRFKENNAGLFKHGELWSLDLHRKKIMDWLPLNSKVA